jgi:hypothetical protein
LGERSSDSTMRHASFAQNLEDLLRRWRRLRKILAKFLELGVICEKSWKSSLISAPFAQNPWRIP